MEQTEIGKKLARIEESVDNLTYLKNLTYLQNRLLNSNTASHIQSVRLQVRHLTKCIKSNIHSIHSLLIAPIHKVTIYEVDPKGSTKTTIVHMTNATEEEIRRYFKLQNILSGKAIEILEIKKIPSQIIDG